MTVVASAACALAGAPHAGAAVSCSYAAGTLTIVTDEATAIGRLSTAIVVSTPGGSVPCSGSPTIDATVEVEVQATIGPGSQLTIDQTGGSLASLLFDLTALTVESGGAIVVLGTGGDDTLTLGTAGIALDVDDDVDVLLPADPGDIRILAGEGNDAVATQGGFGSGSQPAPPGYRLYVSGGPGNDTIDVTDGNDGPGGDLVEGGPGDDAITGDFADGVLFVNAPAGGTIDIAAGVATTGDGNDTFSPIQSVFGTPFADLVLGSPLSDVIFGLGGDDEIHGGTSQDVLDGGEGDDRLFGEGGADNVTGGPGDDVLSAAFGGGFAVDLRGGPGDDRYEVAFGSAAGTIEIGEGPDDGMDELAVTCTPGLVTQRESAPDSGTITRDGESLAYAGVETVSLAQACTPTASAPGAPSPGPGSGSAPQPPGAGAPPGGASIPVTAQEPEVGAVIVAGWRLRRAVRLHAGASFHVLAGQAVEPTAWAWRIRRGRAVLVRATPEVHLRGTGLARRIRALVTASRPPAWTARADLPRGVRRALWLSIPATTLGDPALRRLVVERAAPVAPSHRLRRLPRALRALDRTLGVFARERVVARLVVTAPRSTRWLNRLERLPADRLRGALGKRRIVLSSGATLLLRPVAGAPYALISFREW